MDRETKTAAQVVAEEKLALGEQNVYSGLAFSGGGVRSASFGMGVLQALHQKNILSTFDYLSTVSGGGYLGSSLTWFLSCESQEGKRYNTSDNFPFPGDSISANRTPLQFIRQHIKYPTPGVMGLDGASFVAIILRGMLTSLFVYFSFLIFTFYCLIAAADQFASSAKDLHTMLGYVFLAFSALSGLWFLVESLVFALRTSRSKASSGKRYRSRTRLQARLGRLLSAGLAFLVLGSLPFVHIYFSSQIAHIVTSLLFMLAGVGAGVLQRRRDQSGIEPTTTSNNFIVGFSLIFIYGMLVLSYAGAVFLFLHDIEGAVLIASVFTLAVVVGWLANLNYSGLNRMYRDRLMETFLPDVKNVQENRWGLAGTANEANIADMCLTGQGHNINRPYHLVNANIILTDSKNPRFRGRQGDAFLFSPKYIGSDATGYIESSSYMKDRGGMTLATAMSISGAALNPNTDILGRGSITNRLISTLMALLNLRMGYWAINPRRKTKVKPNYISPGLAGGILTTDALNEESKLVEVSDGGGFENLGLYELFRRQVGLIVIADAGQDPSYQFSDLANAIELARVDFGVNIDFKGRLGSLLPGSCEEEGLSVEKYALAKQGYACADIVYKNAPPGKLIYLKATMIPKLPVDVLGYKNEYPSFPNQTTANQFFDEAQFEAYRQLGLHIAKEMLDKTDANIFNNSTAVAVS